VPHKWKNNVLPELVAIYESVRFCGMPQAFHLHCVECKLEREGSKRKGLAM